jgi:hypothetical protein
MSARSRTGLGRVTVWARRGVMIALPLLLVGMLVAGFALAPTPTARQAARPTGSDGVLPPSRARPPSLPVPAGSTTVSTEATASTPASRTQRLRAPAAWGGVGDPERPPSPGSPVDAMLAVSRRFAAAYMPYQLGRLPGWARTAITRTCTPAFAYYLLARPAEQSPLLRAHPTDAETYRVASVNLAAGSNRASVSYVSEQDRADTGAFLLTLAERHGRWLVAGLET